MTPKWTNLEIRFENLRWDMDSDVVAKFGESLGKLIKYDLV